MVRIIGISRDVCLKVVKSIHIVLVLVIIARCGESNPEGNF